MVSIVIISLAGFGIQDVILGSTGRNIATVGKEKISINEFVRSVENELLNFSKQNSVNLTIEEAKNLSADEMTTEIGSLPPMKIHCGQMVEGALKSALDSDLKQNANQNINDQSTLAKSLVQNTPSSGKIKIVPISDHSKKES